jgi:hypothetical protein
MHFEVGLPMYIEPNPFNPPFGLSNKHTQTILSSVGPRRLKLKRINKQLSDAATEHILTVSDGVRLLCYHNVSQQESAKTLVILIHGWEGSEVSSYMLSATAELLKHGYDVVRLNLRDHGNSHHLNEQAFNSTLLDEMVQAIESIQSKLVYERYHLAGFSLGGNFCLRIAAEAHGHAIKLSSASAFCPVVHAELANSALVERRNWLYNFYFVQKWKRSLRLKNLHFPELYSLDQFAKLKSLDDMNQVLIPRYTSFTQLSDYFDAYAIVGDRLQNTVCPCYLHFAKDDMIIPVAGIARINKGENLQIVVTEHGGHCGFLSNWRFDSWQDERIVQIIDRFEKVGC